MSVLYLLTAPPPPFAGTDAVQQDVAALRHAFGAKLLNLSPLKTSMRRFPKQLFGVHRVRELQALESQCSINLYLLFHALPLPNPAPPAQTGVLHRDGKPRCKQEATGGLAAQ